ncbi:UNVERIFIED_CONTAM: hypothetical protein FKN15_052843 [Acipenser sinensis]
MSYTNEGQSSSSSYPMFDVRSSSSRVQDSSRSKVMGLNGHTKSFRSIKMRRDAGDTQYSSVSLEPDPVVDNGSGIPRNFQADTKDPTCQINSQPSSRSEVCRYSSPKHFHRPYQTKTSMQGDVYHFLERPSGQKCFLYHFTVSAAAAEGSTERQGAGLADGVRGAQVEESAEMPLPAPRVKKRIATEEQSVEADPPTESTVQEPPANPEGSFTAVIKKKKMQKRSEAVVMGESIWGPVADHKGSGEPQLAAPGEPSHNLLVGGDAGSQPSAAAVGESGPGESGGDGGDQAMAAELPRTGKEASGSVGLASSDAMALPSAESSRPEEDEGQNPKRQSVSHNTAHYTLTSSTSAIDLKPVYEFQVTAAM